MEMVAHDPKAAKRVGVPQSVGKDFADADKGKKFKQFKQGGQVSSFNYFKGKETASEESAEKKASKTKKAYAKGEAKEPSTSKFKKGGIIGSKTVSVGSKGDGVAQRGKTGCKVY